MIPIDKLEETPSPLITQFELQVLLDCPSDDAACLLIGAGSKNFICAGTTVGPHAHQLMYQNLRGDFGKDVCDPSWFNPGFSFRIWRDSGIGYALGQNRPEHSLDGQARTPAEAVEMAGFDGVIVTANNVIPIHP